MSIQMILCVETNKQADTDSIYITEAINRYFVVDNKVKISKVYMGTKTKYKSKDVLREINQKIKMYTIGESQVIYCIDTDQFETNPEHQREFQEIINFCEEHGYELIWFCHDVEEVFLGKKISDKLKRKEAADFRKNKKIEQVDVKCLASANRNCRMSNMFNILEKYLSRK